MGNDSPFIACFLTCESQRSLTLSLLCIVFNWLTILIVATIHVPTTSQVCEVVERLMQNKMTLSLQFKDYTPSANKTAKNMTRRTCACVDYCSRCSYYYTALAIIIIIYTCMYYAKGTNHLVYHMQI